MLLFFFWVTNKMIEMAEEFKKYKDIFAREQKEFREEMEREVSTFLPFQFRQRKAVSELGVARFYNEFCKNFSFESYGLLLLYNPWVLL